MYVSCRNEISYGTGPIKFATFAVPCRKVRAIDRLCAKLSTAMAGNRSLQAANKAKKDEFYTQLSDIENELRHYSEHFRGKTVLCNCDDPRVSNFFHSLDFSALHHEVNSLTEGAAAPSVSLPSRQEGVSVAGFSAASPSCGKAGIWHCGICCCSALCASRFPKSDGATVSTAAPQNCRTLVYRVL